MKRTAFKTLAAFALVLSLTLCLPGCAGIGTAQTPQEKYTAVVKQLPGVVEALADLALTAPVDDQTKAQLSEYATLAKTAAIAIGNLDVSKAETLELLQRLVSAISNVIQASNADSQTKSQVANYVAWANVAMRAAGILGALI